MYQKLVFSSLGISYFIKIAYSVNLQVCDNALNGKYQVINKLSQGKLNFHGLYYDGSK